MSVPLFADMPAAPFVAIQSGMAAVGISLALAFVTGGFWLVRRFQGRPVGFSARSFFLVLGIAASGTIAGLHFAAAITSRRSEGILWIVAGGFAILTVLLSLAAIPSRKPPETGSKT